MSEIVRLKGCPSKNRSVFYSKHDALATKQLRTTSSDIGYFTGRHYAFKKVAGQHPSERDSSYEVYIVEDALKLPATDRVNDAGISSAGIGMPNLNLSNYTNGYSAASLSKLSNAAHRTEAAASCHVQVGSLGTGGFQAKKTMKTMECDEAMKKELEMVGRKRGF